MKCPFCEHPKAHKHGRTSKGSQRFYCPGCHETFTDTFDTLHYRRQVKPEEIETILQSHVEGSSLRGISRIAKRAYNTVVSVVRTASYKAQLVHNEEIKDINTEGIVADEMWSFIQKNRSSVNWKNST
jgi:transposase-like protein